MILPNASALTWTLSLAAALAYAVSAAGSRYANQTLPRIIVWLAWLLHGFLLAWGLWGDARPLFGFAPALSVTAWLVGLVYAIENLIYPQLETPWILSSGGAAAVLLMLFFPGEPLGTQQSAWLPLHWALGIASYGLFAVAVLHAWMMMRAETRIRLASSGFNGMPLLTMERLTFRFVNVGFVLLSATLVAGFFFSSQLYGSAHPFRSDHKSVFAILSWLTFGILLIGRARFGWRGRKAARVLYVGTGLLLLAYVGSRFVIEVILGKSL